MTRHSVSTRVIAQMGSIALLLHSSSNYHFPVNGFLGLSSRPHQHHQHPVGTTVRASFAPRTNPISSVPSLPSSTRLNMAADDFNEKKYTESAWACMATLPSAADYYQATTIEGPLLLDVILNPSKFNAGENADSAKRVAEKVLGKVGVDLKGLRQELDVWMGKQAKVVTGNEGGADVQKSMGRRFARVLEKARGLMGTLGVSLLLFV